MRNKKLLKEQYIFRHTKNWDEETKQKYISNVEEDFSIFYGGYLEAIKELSHEVMPILEFSEHKVSTSAGIFQQSVSKLIKELKVYKNK